MHLKWIKGKATDITWIKGEATGIKQSSSILLSLGLFFWVVDFCAYHTSTSKASGVPALCVVAFLFWKGISSTSLTPCKSHENEDCPKIFALWTFDKILDLSRTLASNKCDHSWAVVFSGLKVGHKKNLEFWFHIMILHRSANWNLVQLPVPCSDHWGYV